MRLPESSPLPSTRMPAPRMLGAEGEPGLCGGGARGSASSPLRPLPAHEHRLTFPAAVDLRLRAAEALPQDVLLHLCGDPLALRARAIAHQPPHPRPAATLCPETGGQAKARCHVKLNLDKTHKKEKLESGRCVGWSGAEVVLPLRRLRLIKRSWHEEQPPRPAHGCAGSLANALPSLPALCEILTRQHPAAKRALRALAGGRWRSWERRHCIRVGTRRHLTT